MVYHLKEKRPVLVQKLDEVNMVPKNKGSESPCRLCENPKVWLFSYKWYMKHAEQWGHGCRIWIRYNEFELRARDSRSCGRQESKEGYLHNLQVRLGMERKPRPWQGYSTRYYQMYVPGLDNEKWD